MAVNYKKNNVNLNKKRQIPPSSRAKEFDAALNNQKSSVSNSSTNVLKNNVTSNTKKSATTSANTNKPLTSAQALNNYNKVQSQKPSEFKYDDKQLNKLYNEAMNRKDFSFDLNGNAFYNQYKDKFTKQGQMAMADTVGQVAAASGGYGNSYAQIAGQQVYQQNLDQLNDIVPDLYNLAFQQYQYEGQQLQDKYAMATGERDFAYGQHRDNVSDWQYDNDTAYNIYADTRNYEYQQGRDAVADKQWQQSFDENKRQYDTSLAFDKERAAVADNQWAQEFGYQKQRDQVSDTQWQQTFDENKRQYDTSLAFDKERAAVADSQWQQNFGENQRQFNLNYGLEKDKFTETKNQNAIQNQQWQQNFGENQRQFNLNYGLEKDKFTETKNQNAIQNQQWQQSFGEDQRQFNLNFGLEQDRFNETKNQNAIQNQQWQQTFDRGVYESDRDYNRGVYESDRNYNRGVYESDRNYNRGVYESDRNFNEGQRQFNASLDFDNRQLANSISQADRNYNLSQQELAETIRHNKANEGYNTASLGLDSRDPFGESTGSSGETGDFDPKKINPTSSYDRLSNQSKQLYDQAMLRGYDVKGENGVVMKIYDGIENGSITPEDAMWLFNRFGYDPTTGKFKN